MRINIYSEEMTPEVELITKEGVIGADGEPVTFHGIRFWLKSPTDLHTTEHDDDRNAVTFWIHLHGDDLHTLWCRFQEAGDQLMELGTGRRGRLQS
jgi:hypothetical protein